ncbi:MAG: hypothetical protein LBC35_07840, partial [Coriobacteriales bacterium]|nr:hypothetical protein [Coriobacteriales bacterium]
ELIVVIVILGILAAIAIPALTGYISKAQDEGLKAEGRTVEVAVQTIGSDLHNTLLISTHPTIGQLADASGKAITPSTATSTATPDTVGNEDNATRGEWISAINNLAATNYDPITGATVAIQYIEGNKVAGLLFTKSTPGTASVKWAYYDGATWEVVEGTYTALTTTDATRLKLSGGANFTPNQP